AGHFEPAVTVRRSHHGNLDAHVAQASDAICPGSLDWGAAFELETKFGKELDGGIEVCHHDADVVHALDRHDVFSQRGVRTHSGRTTTRQAPDAFVTWRSCTVFLPWGETHSSESFVNTGVSTFFATNEHLKPLRSGNPFSRISFRKASSSTSAVSL